MASRPCKINGCERLAGVPGSGRGWCGAHYQKWQKYGDPLVSTKRQRAVCSIDGCGQWVLARTWCTAHYGRWENHGDPEVRLRGQVRDGRRICPRCQLDLPLDNYGNHRSKSNGQSRYCKSCTCAITAEWRTSNPHPPVATHPEVCDHCGNPFQANGRRSRYCTPECGAAHKNKANWKHLNARRTRLRDAFVEVFDRREIFERDGWVCQICLAPVDRIVPWPDPASPSLDHIVPIALGGKHERANAQTSHLACNVRKGVSIRA